MVKLNKEQRERNRTNKEILVSLGYNLDELARYKGKCRVCKAEINLEDFKDILSLKEYLYSGICYKCFYDVYDYKYQTRE